MSLPKKKSRLITVENVQYCWLSSGNDNGVNIYIELAEDPGQLLYAVELYDYGEDGNLVEVTPSIVASIIRKGLSKGWVPEKNGDVFFIK